MRTLAGHTDTVRRVAFDPSGNLLASAGDSTVRLWNIQDGQAAALLSGHRGMVFGVRFSPDGRYLLSHSFDQTVRLWDVMARRRLLVFSLQAVVMDACFSPDGRMVVAAGNDGIAYVYGSTVDALIDVANSRLPVNLTRTDREQLVAR